VASARRAWSSTSTSAGCEAIHGAPDIGHHATAWALGRGGIKWALRGCLARGEWGEWGYSRRSTKHVIEDGAMTLALRPNGRPGQTKEG
jgi:hypothetical protein